MPSSYELTVKKGLQRNFERAVVASWCMIIKYDFEIRNPGAEVDKVYCFLEVQFSLLAFRSRRCRRYTDLWGQSHSVKKRTIMVVLMLFFIFYNC